MVDKKIEDRIRTAIGNTTPDVLSKIYASCNEQKGTVINMEKNRDNYSKAKKWMGSIIAAAAVMLVALGGLSINYWNTANKVSATVILDVNPSIHLNVNANERVLSVEPGNEDGKKVLGDMDLKNTKLDVAVNALIGSMLKNGYLSELHNSILVSVEDDDLQEGASLQSRLTETIEQIFKNSRFDSVVFAQTVAADQTIKELSKQYNISEGKAALIKELIQQDGSLNFEELAKLSVHEIALIMESKGIEPRELTKTGAASKKAYIGEEQAKAKAFAHAGVNAGRISSVEVEFDAEDGIMVYEVEFRLGPEKYEFYINAVTGEIIKYSRETDEDDNDDFGKGHKNKSGEEGRTDSRTEEASFIGKEKAKAIAFTHASVNENQLSDLEIEQDDDRAVYKIEFKTADAEYEYVIDAKTGEIIKAEQEERSSSGKSGSKKTSKDYISKEEALAAALKHAGLSKSYISKSKVKLDKDESKPAYEIEFESADKEYEYEIDAYTGKVLKAESEDRELKGSSSKRKDAKEASGSNVTPAPEASGSYIGEARAKEIALGHSGVDAGQVRELEIEFDYEDGRAIYEIEFKAGNTDYEYELDAATGKVLKAEADKDD